MTLFLNDFADDDPETHLKLMNLIECFIFNGSEIIIILLIVKVLELHKEKIMGMIGFDIFVFCQR